MRSEQPDDCIFRPPELTDAVRITSLIRQCKPLDTNSHYLTLLLCSHFRDTCVVAEDQGEIVGFISAYCPPNRPETIFIWQVAVSEQARSRGIASRMLDHLLAREVCQPIRLLEATVTPSNEPSRRLFAALARRHGTECTSSAYFPAELFEGLESHEAEELIRVGPCRFQADADS